MGTFAQDRHTGIMGVFNRQPEMIPVTLSIHGSTGVKQFHYESGFAVNCFQTADLGHFSNIATYTEAIVPQHFVTSLGRFSAI